MDDVEIWELRANTHHPIYPQLVHFQVLSRGRDESSKRDAGWKDTVNLDNGGDAEILIKFDSYRGKYIFHCHNLEHEDMAMMATIRTVPGPGGGSGA